MITFKKVPFSESIQNIGNTNVFSLTRLVFPTSHFIKNIRKTNKFLLSQKIQNCSFGGIPEMLVVKNKPFLKIVQKPLHQVMFSVRQTICFHAFLRLKPKRLCFCERSGSENLTVSKVSNSDGAESSKKMFFEK